MSIWAIRRQHPNRPRSLACGVAERATPRRSVVPPPFDRHGDTLGKATSVRSRFRAPQTECLQSLLVVFALADAAASASRYRSTTTAICPEATQRMGLQISTVAMSPVRLSQRLASSARRVALGAVEGSDSKATRRLASGQDGACWQRIPNATRRAGDDARCC